MAYFEWREDMAIDGGPIDAEHRKLVDLVNRLHDATSVGQGRQVVGALLQELILDTATHLQHEEALMQELGFADLPQHRQGHQAFVAELQRLQEQWRQGRLSVAAQLSTLLRDWLSLHIRRHDKELHEFIRRKRRGQDT
ncbi:MAG: bacteriohemerythrin [Hylemonella sp.]|jgi:hemerythrin